MSQSEAETLQNPLESELIGKLIFKYSIPAIISSLVGSIYNIVDQIFIGNSIGEKCSIHVDKAKSYLCLPKKVILPHAE